MRYWILKTEPSTYSIDDLARDGVTPWEGVRNYQARNYMRDAMGVGDVVFIYHSNCPMPGIVGEGRVHGPVHDDMSALDPDGPYVDPRSTIERNRWQCVDISYVRTYPRTVTLRELIDDPVLIGLAVAKRGNRLSITPVQAEHGLHIIARANRDVQ